MSGIFGIEKTPRVQESTPVEGVIDMGTVLRHLSQSKGKLEITFQKNENPAYESLCLAFIKIPVYGPTVGILKGMIDSENVGETPLSKGKLSVDSKDESLHAFVGAIRIKNINKTADILNILLDRMKTMLKTAVYMSKRDDIGNMSIPVKSTHSFDTNKKVRKKSPSTKPYTFSRERD